MRDVPGHDQRKCEWNSHWWSCTPDQVCHFCTLWNFCTYLIFKNLYSSWYLKIFIIRNEYYLVFPYIYLIFENLYSSKRVLFINLNNIQNVLYHSPSMWILLIMKYFFKWFVTKIKSLRPHLLDIGKSILKRGIIY